MKIGAVFLLALGLAAAVGGCAVGPDYRQPEAPSVKGFTSGDLPGETASAPGPNGGAQRFAPGKEIPAEWWALFHSEALDRLIRAALGDSPTLAAARAALLTAKENLQAESGVLYPSVDASFSANRNQFTGAAFGQPGATISPFSLLNASVSVSYALDFFGAARRELEALRSQVDYEGFQVQGTYLALTANVVTTSVKEASLRAQVAATREIEAAEEKQLELAQRQFELGGVSRSEVLAQQTQLAQTRATLPPLVKQLVQSRNQLAVLIGKFPSEEGELPYFELEDLELPQELPVSVASALVRQRPDIRASEALLHAASAQIGVATANLFPQVTLTGSLGTESTKFSGLFGSGSSVWGIGAGILQPVFHGGTLIARRRAALAAFDQAAAQYRESVLLGFQNVADVLQALDSDARALKADTDALQAARDALDMTEKQFRFGAVNYLLLLDAQRQFHLARIEAIRARETRFADTAALFQALGGGWWNRTP